MVASLVWILCRCTSRLEECPSLLSSDLAGAQAARTPSKNGVGARISPRPYSLHLTAADVGPTSLAAPRQWLMFLLSGGLL